jgi:hypothetical protein
MKPFDAVAILAFFTTARKYSLSVQSFIRYYSSYYQDCNLDRIATPCTTLLQSAITQLAMKKVCWYYQNLAVNSNMTPQPVAFPPFSHEAHMPRDWKTLFKCLAPLHTHVLNAVKLLGLSFTALTAIQAGWDTIPPALSIQNVLPKSLGRPTAHLTWPLVGYSISSRPLIHSLSRLTLDAAISVTLSSTLIRVSESCL